MAQFKVETQADRDKAQLESLRSNRTLKLRATDWTQLPDAPVSAAAKQTWATYRQSLRDLPTNTTDPYNPTWPTSDWIPGVPYHTQEHVTYNSQEYVCIQPHTSQEDWTPDATPALWQPYTAPVGNAWSAGVAYNIGDTVTYQGTTYTCLQAHTSQVGWEPPNVPALWQAQ